MSLASKTTCKKQIAECRFECRMTFAQHMGENRHWSAGIYWSAGIWKCWNDLCSKRTGANRYWNAENAHTGCVSRSATVERQNATECGRERVVRSKSTRANQLIYFIVSDSRVQARSHKISIEQWDDLTLIWFPVGSITPLVKIGWYPANLFRI